MFMFPHKTEEQFAKDFNSYGKLCGVIPVYFNLTKMPSGAWLFDSPENGEVAIQDANWVPRWVFKLGCLVLAWRLVGPVLLGTGDGLDIPLTWHRWVGVENQDRPNPDGEEDSWGV